MTFAELKSEVYRRLRESTDAPVFWNDADVEEALNEGYAELADASEFHEKHQNIDLLKARPYYDMRYVPRDDFLVAGPAFNVTTNRWLIPTTPSELERADLMWEDRIAEPERFMVRGLWWLGYWPYKDVATGEIKQYYKGLPDAMSDDDDVPVFHASCHYALVEFALFDLFAQDSETDLAWAAWKEYLTYESKVMQYMKNRAAVPMHHGWANNQNGA